MSLQDLPSEILAEIARYLGPLHFRSNLSHLILCKKWYPLAQNELRTEIFITLDKLRELYHLKYDRTKPKQSWPEWSTSQTHTICIDIAKANELNFTLDTVIQRVHQHAGILTQFTRSLSQLKRLKTLRAAILTECYNYHDSFNNFMERFVGPWNMVARQMLVTLSLASPPALTHIELDLRGEGFFNFRRDDIDYESMTRPHLCTGVNDLFQHHTHLRDVRLRLACICSDVASVYDLELASLALETLIINIGLFSLGQTRCRDCGPVSWDCQLGTLPSYDDARESYALLAETVVEFAGVMREPKMLRLLGPEWVLRKGYDGPRDVRDEHGRVAECAYDCLTDKEYRLPLDDHDWARMGTVIDE